MQPPMWSPRRGFGPPFMHVQSVVQHLSESAAVSQDGVCGDATAPGLQRWRDSTGSGFVPSGNFDWRRADRLLGQPERAWDYMQATQARARVPTTRSALERYRRPTVSMPPGW